MRNGYTPSKSVPEYWENGTIPWFRMEDIRTNGGILSDSIQHITPEAVKGGRLFPSGSIILSTTATIGEHALLIADSLANQRFTNLVLRESLSNKLDIKFFYYYMFIVDDWCKRNTNVSGFASVDMKKLKKLPIPIPPLEVQAEVVMILDKFSRLTSELQKELDAELKARKLQYEYYRDQLLSFGIDDHTVQWLPLGEVAEYPKDRIEASNLSEDNYISVDNLLKDKQGKKRSEFVPSEGRFINYKIGDILVGNIRPYLKKIWLANNNGGTNGDVLVYRINYNYEKKLSPKYLYYILSSDDFFYYSVKYSKGAKMPRGDKYMNLNYVIPIPPIAEQERIVGILDKFDKLTNSLTEGIPKEIEMRQLQYEYYRDALLSF